tara:strand:+ start:16228 stop:17307 length:1080 start_codon:yes stop_codon:yes gene_type:complete
MSNTVTLSASRIKTYKSCSWIYWLKYIQKAPDSDNDGSRRGSICHLVLECLGNPRHKKRHYKKLLKDGVKNDTSIHRLIVKWAKRLELDLDKYVPIISKNLVKGKDLISHHVDGEDISNLGLVYHMIDEGLNYDFYGTAIGEPSESHDEIKFTLKKEGYNAVGFIDKLFIYKKEGTALIRDFKTSKSSLKGEDLYDNIQALMYALAVRDLYPESFRDKILVEFVFLRLTGRKGDVVRFEVGNNELDGFEEYLKEIQSNLENFSLADAKSGLAAHKGWPSDGSFSGKMLCGRAKSKGEKKLNGEPMWHCPYKFDFDYYSLVDKTGKIISSSLDFEDLCDHPDFLDCTIKHKVYDGCPAHN